MPSLEICPFAEVSYREFSTDDVAETKEVQEGVLIDFSGSKAVCGTEILHVSKREWFKKEELEKLALKDA
ncbi:MAG: DUF2283 domain-containing protein [Candidatus Brocadiales bacterium]|nr:DUF2283 domain-containing protein [Candidatus Brocadiales bacterium]